MSKTYDEAVRKAQALAQGVRNNLEKATALGITPEQIDRLLAIAEETSAKSREVDELRSIVAQKSSEARQSLDNLTDIIRPIKKAIKTSIDQPSWLTFGIEDKR